MQNTIIDIKGHWVPQPPVNEILSFSAFTNYIKRRIECEQTIKSEFYRFVLNKFEKHAGTATDQVDINNICDHKDLLELVYTVLSPEPDDESKFYWGLSTPIPSRVFYSSPALYDFLNEHNSNTLKIVSGNSNLFKQKYSDFIYRIILQKLYNFPSDLNNDVIYSVIDPKTKLNKYFKIHTDISFIDIEVNGALPPLNPEIIEPCIYEGAGMDILTNTLPLSMFAFKGFSVITIKDITSDYAVETIRNALVNNVGSRLALYKKVKQALQTLSTHASIQFGILPFIRLNGVLKFDAEECASSFIVKTNKRYKNADEVFLAFLKKYIHEPRAMFFSTISNKKIEQYPFLKALHRAGVKSFAILPVYYNRHLVGIMEVYSAQKMIFYEKLLSRIQTAVPLISQLLKDSSDRLESKIEFVIKNKYTTIQPSVEWKFNEAAWRYLNRRQTKKDEDLETVTFERIHPLYGSVDMRNSTEEHNAAFNRDMQTLSAVLHDTITAVSGMLPKKAAAALLTQYRSWKRKLVIYERSHDETLLKTLLYDNINPYLIKLKNGRSEVSPLIDDYLKAVNESTGKVYVHRNQLEISIKKINGLLSKYFENQATRLQRIFPCYFEKFRSDGIEYDVYTGQGLSKDIAFKPGHLKRFRQWQLKSMLDVSILTNALLPKLPIPIQTASLIFVHSSQIDICFRNDERRFDVEGYYNIRYEVIKKRIDKAVIKHTGERLTQPGKIALVYFNDEEIKSYVDYIKKLQTARKLKNDLEHVVLDELQGVHGIKALRVSINYPK